MNIGFLYGRNKLHLEVPDDTTVFASKFPEPENTEAETVLQSVRKPIATKSLAESLKGCKGNVAVVVSDITRPIPYTRFLPELMHEIESAKISKRKIVIIIATGMHRPSTEEERVEMFGKDIVDRYRIVDHKAEDEATLIELPGKSWSGAKVRINREFAEAEFKIITGLVEPHFMAGFSGGRKAVCPGLVSLETVKQFHGYEFLSSPLSCNGNLKGNSCHLESTSIAKLAGVDFSVNVVLNNERKLVRAFSGKLEESHVNACKFVSSCSCPEVETEADIAVTSCGGYPLDATFYQCVKGMVSCIPAVKRNGIIISLGSCLEGIGSPEYQSTMEKYSGRWRDYIMDIQIPGHFIKDQWQFQMQSRALEKVGEKNLHFITHGIEQKILSRLSVNGSSAGEDEIKQSFRKIFDSCFKEGMKVAVFPEGPYCAPRN